MRNRLRDKPLHQFRRGAGWVEYDAPSDVGHAKTLDLIWASAATPTLAALLADGAAVAASWLGAELVTTRGLGHRRILRDPAVVLRVAEFLEARLLHVSPSAAAS